ncbi:MAG TPA: hypothetical protein PKL15_16500, partial [Saprospiraceae bacterium]|nr:hypothetical protein [Saprospiraceae bacterium]
SFRNNKFFYEIFRTRDKKRGCADLRYFCLMEKNTHSTGETPPDCFRLEELDAFQTVENQVLVDVNYYLWLNQAEADEAPYRFLYYLELVFDEQPPLLLTSGDDSEAIRVSDAGALLKTADALRRLHGKVIIQRVNAGNLPLWQPLIGQTLNAVRLSRNEQLLYRNDALLLDFGARQVLVQLSDREGLLATNWE